MLSGHCHFCGCFIKSSFGIQVLAKYHKGEFSLFDTGGKVCLGERDKVYLSSTASTNGGSSTDKYLCSEPISRACSIDRSAHKLVPVQELRSSSVPVSMLPVSAPMGYAALRTVPSHLVMSVET